MEFGGDCRRKTVILVREFSYVFRKLILEGKREVMNNEYIYRLCYFNLFTDLDV